MNEQTFHLALELRVENNDGDDPFRIHLEPADWMQSFMAVARPQRHRIHSFR